MSDETKILERIAADASAEAESILSQARAQADAQVANAQTKADKELAALLKLADAEAAKAAAKAISGAEMTAKKEILATKQAILAEVIDAAHQQLLRQTDQEVQATLTAMLGQADLTGGQVLLSEKDKKRFGKALADQGYPVGDETRDIDGGFIVKCGDVEYNYSYASILAIQREEIETLAAGILFG